MQREELYYSTGRPPQQENNFNGVKRLRSQTENPLALSAHCPPVTLRPLMWKGFATAEGTARYRDRFPRLREAGHFRRAQGAPGAGELWMSSIGLGTYLGEPDAAGDARYTQAIMHALRSGINVLDTAIKIGRAHV